MPIFRVRGRPRPTFHPPPQPRSIFHTHQIKPACRSRSPGRGAVPRLQNSSHIHRRQSFFADQQKSSHQIAHHVVKKSISPHGIDHILLRHAPSGRKDFPHIALLSVSSGGSPWPSGSHCFRIHRRKRSEVMFSHHQPSGLSASHLHSADKDNAKRSAPKMAGKYLARYIR